MKQVGSDSRVTSIFWSKILAVREAKVAVPQLNSQFYFSLIRLFTEIPIEDRA